jgi:dihydrofolate reductase
MQNKRKIILGLAISLDGFIESPNGEFDWCFTDQDYGMKEFFSHVDTLFIGRKSYEVMQSLGEEASAGFPKMKEYVFSNTLDQVKPGATLVKGDAAEAVRNILQKPGKDIWLFGGASLTAYFLEHGLVDQLWLSVHPILLGSGKRLFPECDHRRLLHLTATKTYNTGLVSLTYDFSKQNLE